MKKTKVYLIGIICLLFFFKGSCEREPEKPINVEDPESYKIDDRNAAIETEYRGTYKFLSGEYRLIFVCGTQPTSSYKRISVLDNLGNKQFDFELTNTSNSYYNSQNLTYTAPLIVNAPSGTGIFFYPIRIEDMNTGNYSQSSFTVEIISHRNYMIEYSCMGSSYDLRTLGYDFTKSIKDTYSDAHVSTDINTFNSNIPQIVLREEDVSTNQALIDWGNQYASDGAGHNPDVVVLFAVKDYAGAGSTVGRTGRDMNDLYPPRKAYCYVFIDRINSIFSTRTEDERKVIRTRTAIHELAHGADRNQPNTMFKDWHNGRKKNNCVFSNVVNSYDPTKTLSFCEGHKQALMYLYW